MGRRLPGKEFSPQAAEIIMEVVYMDKLANGERNTALQPVKTVRTKTVRRVKLSKRKMN